MEELMREALKILENDEIFAQCCEELDSWNGFLGDDRLCNMEYELDELHYGLSLSDVLKRVDFSLFNLSDAYWYYNGCGNIVSFNGTKGEFYGNLYYNTEILDELINNFGNLDLAWISPKLADLVEQIANFEDEE